MGAPRLAHRADKGLRHVGVWIYLSELAPDYVVEFGHVLPPDGGEGAWRAGLPDADRAWMASLAR